MKKFTHKAASIRRNRKARVIVQRSLRCDVCHNAHRKITQTVYLPDAANMPTPVLSFCVIHASGPQKRQDVYSGCQE
jgi:nitrate/TMAO reductase-like tetraheme cytochrome c subunit